MFTKIDLAQEAWIYQPYLSSCFSQGIDEAYDAALQEFFGPYHVLVDLMVRVSVNNQNLTESLINLSAAVAYEGVPLHLPYFAKLWYEIYQSEHVDKSYVGMLCSSHFFIDYMDAVLLDERQALNNHHIYQFFCNYFPKVRELGRGSRYWNKLDNENCTVALLKISKKQLLRFYFLKI